MEEKTKKGLRFNVIDIAIILIVIGCIVGLVLRAMSDPEEDTKATKGTPATITVQISSFPKEIDFNLHEGDLICYTANGKEFGTVTSIKKTEPNRNTANAKGQIVYAPFSQYDDYEFTLDCLLEEKDYGLYVSGAEYCAVGSVLHFKTPQFAHSGTIIDIEFHESQNTEAE